MSKYANDLDMMSQALLAQMQRERDDAIKASMQMQRERDDAIKASMQDMATVESLRQCEPVAYMYVNSDGECEEIAYGQPPFDDEWWQLLYTHPAPAVPYDVEKWQLVPKEPTEEMLNAACLSQAECEFKDYDDWRDAHSNATVKSLRNILKKDYESMLQAAPKPEDV